jgi:ferritin
MLSKKMNDLLNHQVGVEFFSSYSYLAMAGYFDNEELFGFANFFRVQAKEEITHAMKVFDYIGKAGGRVELGRVDAPKNSYKNPSEAFTIALAHEKKVTQEINHIMDVAMGESDHATRVLLNWFVTEQLEEETLFSTCLKRVKMVGEDGKGLLILDQEFAKRAGEAVAE